jgi:transcriptional regulator with XRE-family HTH domain
MKISAYEINIMLLIKVFRKVRYVKQLTVAIALNMSTANYSKIESGFWSINLQQLRVICNVIGISIAQLIALAEAFDDLKYRVTPLSHMLVGIINTVKNDKGEVTLEKVQLEEVVRKIRDIDLASFGETP